MHEWTRVIDFMGFNIMPFRSLIVQVSHGLHELHELQATDYTDCLEYKPRIARITRITLYAPRMHEWTLVIDFMGFNIMQFRSLIFFAG
jgi:hypothetical protein